jgi:hypothetical protein
VLIGLTGFWPGNSRPRLASSPGWLAARHASTTATLERASHNDPCGPCLVQHAGACGCCGHHQPTTRRPRWPVGRHHRPRIRPPDTSVPRRHQSVAQPLRDSTPPAVCVVRAPSSSWPLPPRDPVLRQIRSVITNFSSLPVGFILRISLIAAWMRTGLCWNALSDSHINPIDRSIVTVSFHLSIHPGCRVITRLSRTRRQHPW